METVDPNSWPTRFLNAMRELVFVKNQLSKITWANTAFCEAYGVALEDMPLREAEQGVDADTVQYVGDDRRVLALGCRRPWAMGPTPRSSTTLDAAIGSLTPQGV